MNQKEFNLLLSELSILIKPINQLLFECLVLIIFYYLFNTITFITKNKSDTKTHESFIYLICLICIVLDWFMWNNCNQTALFTAILVVYIIYNINKSKTISTFINTINDSRNINNNNKKNEEVIKKNILEEEFEKAKKQDELNRITFIPKDIDYSNPNNDPNYSPNAYEKKLNGINELNTAYSSGIPSIHLTDSQYAELQLENLHGSPQYKNIKKMNTDSSLYNYNQTQIDRNSIYAPLEIPINKPIDTCIDTNNEYTEETDINLFRNQKREFLVDNWLTLKENTYNDNCKNCKGNSLNTNNTNNIKNKNAICSAVKYGQELEECTNQTDSVTNNQLDNISSNKIDPVYKF